MDPTQTVLPRHPARPNPYHDPYHIAETALFLPAATTGLSFAGHYCRLSRPSEHDPEHVILNVRYVVAMQTPDQIMFRPVKHTSAIGIFPTFGLPAQPIRRIDAVQRKTWRDALRAAQSLPRTENHRATFRNFLRLAKLNKPAQIPLPVLATLLAAPRIDRFIQWAERFPLALHMLLDIKWHPEANRILSLILSAAPDRDTLVPILATNPQFRDSRLYSTRRLRSMFSTPSHIARSAMRIIPPTEPNPRLKTPLQPLLTLLCHLHHPALPRKRGSSILVALHQPYPDLPTSPVQFHLDNVPEILTRILPAPLATEEPTTPASRLMHRHRSFKQLLVEYNDLKHVYLQILPRLTEQQFILA